MMSMKELFYPEVEPVWILKPEKKESNEKSGDNKNATGSSNKGGSGKEEYSIFNVIPYYPYYYPDYVPTPQGKGQGQGQGQGQSQGQGQGQGQGNKNEKKVILKVPICCGECEETVVCALRDMNGVKSITCDIRREKVTVVVTTAAPADVLLACRRLFRSSRMWSNDD